MFFVCWFNLLFFLFIDLIFGKLFLLKAGHLKSLIICLMFGNVNQFRLCKNVQAWQDHNGSQEWRLAPTPDPSISGLLTGSVAVPYLLNYGISEESCDFPPSRDENIAP